MRPKWKRDNLYQIDIRPVMPKAEVDAFHDACNEAGETETGLVRRLIHKIAAGDIALLNRILR
jgi:hypothetical protein